MRVGLMIGSDTERQRSERLTGLVDDVRAAEREGFSPLWIPQIPGYLDAMTAIALVGYRYRAHRARTAVVPVQTRHPDRDGPAGAHHPARLPRAVHARASGRPTTGSSRTSWVSPTTGRPISCATTSRC